MTFLMCNDAHDGVNPHDEGHEEQQEATDSCTNNAGFIDMKAKHPSGLTNGEALQLWTLVRGIQFHLDTGMHLTRPQMLHYAFLHWMEKAGVSMEGKRPTWRTKGKLLQKHWGHCLTK